MTARTYRFNASRAATMLFYAVHANSVVPVADLLRATGRRDDFSISDAYQVQEALIKLHESAGQFQVGWKIGMTNDERRAAMGLNEPSRGALFADQVWGGGHGRLLSKIPAAHLEPEVAARVLHRIEPGSSVSDVADLVEVTGAIEVVSSRIAGWPQVPFGVALADNSAGWGAVVVDGGVKLAPQELAQVMVTFYGPVGRVSGCGRAVLGQPLQAVRWLAGFLASSGRYLEPGELVLTGALTRALPAIAGQYTAEFSGGLGRVGVEVMG